MFVWNRLSITDDSKLGVIAGKASDKPNQNRFDIPLTTASSTTQSKHEVDPPKPGIKIKEITKPEEIRITDDKPKVFKQAKTPTAQIPIGKELTTSGPPSLVTASMESTTAKFTDDSTTVLNEKDELFTEENLKMESSESTTRDYSKTIESSTVSASTGSGEKHEIEATTEFSSTTSTQAPNDVTTINVLETHKKGEDAAAIDELSTTKGPEITSELSINVVVEHSGRNQSITVVGAAGLQRGDESESGSTTIEPPPSSNNTELLSVKNETSDINRSEENFDEFPASNSSDSSERNETANSMENAYSNEEPSSVGLSDESLNSTTTKYPLDDKVYDTVFHESTNVTSDERSSSTVQPNDEELEVERDINPEFPHIPDDLSIHSAHMTEDALHEKRPLPEKLVSSTISIFDEDLHLVGSSTPGADAIERIEERSPGEPYLVPEWERNQNETGESDSREELDNDIVSKSRINGDYSTESASIELESDSYSTPDAINDDETVGSGGSDGGEFKGNIMSVLGIEEPPKFSVHLSNIYDWFRSS